MKKRPSSIKESAWLLASLAPSRCSSLNSRFLLGGPMGRDGPASLRAGAKKHNQTIKIGNYQKANKTKENNQKWWKTIKKSIKTIKNRSKNVKMGARPPARAHFPVFRSIFDCFYWFVDCFSSFLIVFLGFYWFFDNFLFWLFDSVFLAPALSEAGPSRR